MKPNQGNNLREVDLKTDTSDGNRATRFRAGGNGPPLVETESTIHCRKRTTELAESKHFGAKMKPATGKNENSLLGRRIDTTLLTKHFGAKLTETRPPGRRYLGNKVSTIYDSFFGMDCGDDDSAATSGGWQGGRYPTRMKPPCQFSHPALTGKRTPVRFAYDC